MGANASRLVQGEKNHAGYNTDGVCKGCEHRYNTWGKVMQKHAQLKYQFPKEDKHPVLGLATPSESLRPDSEEPSTFGRMHLIVLRGWNIPGDKDVDWTCKDTICEKCGEVTSPLDCTCSDLCNNPWKCIKPCVACPLNLLPSCASCLPMPQSCKHKIQTCDMTKCLDCPVPKLPKVKLPDAPSMPSLPTLPKVDFPSVDWSIKPIKWANLPSSMLLKGYGDAKVYRNGELQWEVTGMDGTETHVLGLDALETGDVVAVHMKRNGNSLGINSDHSKHTGSFAAAVIWGKGKHTLTGTHWKADYEPIANGWAHQYFNDGGWSRAHAFSRVSDNDDLHAEHKEGPTLPDDARWIWNWSTYDDAYFRYTLQDPKGGKTCATCDNFDSWAEQAEFNRDKNRADCWTAWDEHTWHEKETEEDGEEGGEGGDKGHEATVYDDEKDIRSEEEMKITNAYFIARWGQGEGDSYESEVKSEDRWPDWMEYFSFDFDKTVNKDGNATVEVAFELYSENKVGEDTHLKTLTTNMLADMPWRHTLRYGEARDGDTEIDYLMFYEFDDKQI